MATYTKTTNFTAKDNLTSGDPAKVIKGSEFDTEFNAIETAVNSKANSNNTVLTGTATVANVDAQSVETDALSINSTAVTATAAEINTLDGITSTTAELNKLDGFTGDVNDLNYAKDLRASGVTAAEFDKIDGLTAEASELNILDGATVTTAELNTLDGITATTAELNITDGLTASTSELNILDGATLSTDELNLLDGVTATTAELNITDGLTATTAELNTLDGLTATTTELNYTDGVTSNIQTQLDGKATTAQGALADSAVQPNDNVTFGTGSFSGEISANGGIALGDNDKATFGASDDLQIYHSGSHSIIEDTGTGNLYLKASDLRIQSATGESYIECDQDAGVGIRHNNALKLATTSTGVDVTGTVSADGLTVDGNDSSITTTGSSGDQNFIQLDRDTYGEVGKLSRSAGSLNLLAKQNLTLSADYTNENSGVNSNVYIKTDDKLRASFNSAGDIQFYEDTGTTPKLTWDASEEHLILSGGSSWANNITGLQLGFDDTDGYVTTYYDNTTVTLGAGVSQKTQVKVHGQTSTEGSAVTIQTGGSEAMRIDSSGNVGIGCSPSTKLHVENTAGGSGGYAKFTDVTYGGDVRFGMADGVDNNAICGTWSNNSFQFYTNSTERLRIDSSGNLLVGLTSNTGAVDGVRILQDGIVAATNQSGISGSFNRRTTDGDIVEFSKDGSTVGSIGTANGNTYYALNSTKAITTDGASDIVPCNSAGTKQTGGFMTLGNASYPFNDLYLSGGVYLGGTGSANKLDDYETGTWTPEFGGTTTNPVLTYSYQSGEYIKVGNMCHARFRVQASSVSSDGSGILRITLPFNVPAGQNGWTGSVGWNGSGNGWTTTPFNVEAIVNTNHMYVHSLNLSTGAIEDLQAGDLNNTGLIEGSISFRTT